MREPLGDTEPEGSLPDPVVAAAERADLDELWRAIGELPRRQRTAILLREFSGLSYDELAVALGVSEPAVESLLFRARRELRTRLRPVSGSFVIAPLNAVRDALAPVAVKLGAGATAVVVAGGTVAAVETPTLLREVAAQPAVASVLPARARPVRAAPVGGAARRRSDSRPFLSRLRPRRATRDRLSGRRRLYRIPLRLPLPAASGLLLLSRCRPSRPRPLRRSSPRRHLPSPLRRWAETTPPGMTSAQPRATTGAQGPPVPTTEGRAAARAAAAPTTTAAPVAAVGTTPGVVGPGRGGDRRAPVAETTVARRARPGRAAVGTTPSRAAQTPAARLARLRLRPAATASPKASFRPRAPRSRAPRRSPGAAR